MRALALLLLALGLGLPARADLVVVVNAKSGVEKLTRTEVTNIFLGRYRQLPSGLPALPIDQPADETIKARFYTLLVNKEPAEINAYWARLIFSGKTSPPRQATNAAEVMDWLAGQRGGIGYIERGQTDSRVRIVFELEPKE